MRRAIANKCRATCFGGSPRSTLPTPKRGRFAVGEPGCDRAVQSAQQHYDAIARFGGFPHRNAILGRANTPTETEFLGPPGNAPTTFPAV